MPQPRAVTASVFVSSFMYLMVNQSASAGIIQVQAVIDGESKLVIDPAGLYWAHTAYGTAKPGYHGADYATNGPSFVNGQSWLAQWSIAYERAVDTSSTYAISTANFQGFTLSTQYDGYFDAYGWGAGNPISINRGTVTLSTYNGLPAIDFNDLAQDGQNIYSVNISVPEPASAAAICVAALGFLARRRHQIR